MKNGSTIAKEGKRSPWFASLFNFRFFSDAMPKRSPQAIIDPAAEIDPDVEIGPFCVIGPEVKIESGCRLLNSVTILGRTTIGRDNVFFPNAVIGAAPQDKKYQGSSTELTIGSGNVFREAVTIHVGTEKGGGITRIGDNGLYMVNCHVGHDAQIGNHVVIANNVMLAGHVEIHDFVSIMGGAGLHHFTTVGPHAFIGGYAQIHHDVPPYCKVDNADVVRGVNTVGLKRAGFTEAEITEVKQICRRLFGRKRQPFAAIMTEVENDEAASPHAKALIAFLKRRNEGKHGRYLESQREKTLPAS